jgi:hypothetical protein
MGWTCSGPDQKTNRGEKEKKEKKEPRWVRHCQPGQLGSGPAHIFNYNIILLFKKSSNIFFKKII